MSSKRPRIDIKTKTRADDTPDETSMTDTQLSISSLLQQQYEQALETLNRLAPQQQQLESLREKEMETLKRENQHLRSENNTLRAESDKAAMPDAAPSNGLVATDEALESNYLSRQFIPIMKCALEFDIRSHTAIRPRELEVICGILHCESRKNALRRFMEAPSETPTIIKAYNCLLGASCGIDRPVFKEVAGLLRCSYHKDKTDCVWITKEKGHWWIGSP